MKDYRLSEIQEICKKNIGCKDCELYDENRCKLMLMFDSRIPTDWNINKEQPKDKIETLADTINLMTSADYKERFKAEYYQLKIRYEKLDAMVKNWDNLSFTPTCEKRVYRLQLASMLDYLKILEIRAEIEDIELDKGVNNGTSNN